MATEAVAIKYRNVRFIIASEEEEYAFTRSAAKFALWETQKTKA
jgi:hypothetical protein